MDEFKPEDELKPDPSDRRTGRSRQSSDRDSEPQINFDDVELDADERRPSRSRKAREEAEPEDEYYESEEADDADAEEVVERRPRKRKNAAPRKPASRQYIMMGLGVVVLLVLIVGIGSALKAPSSNDQSASSEKSISLSGDNTDQANASQPQPAQENNPQQDVTLPPISSTPTQGQQTAAPDGQQRVEVQGDLNNALTQPQGQSDDTVVNSTLPTEPATVAPIRNGARPAVTAPVETPRQTATAPRPERKHTVIETKPQPMATVKKQAPAAQSKPVETKPVTTAPKQTVTAATSTPAKAPAAEAAKPAATTAAPAATATTATAAATAAPAATATAAPAATATGKSAGDVGSLKSASGSHYTLQLSSSSNYDNLNGWAKKENLKNYVVYETSRNGQPWYVLVSGIYASKDDAKRAVTTLPADVQAKNPWAKPLHQVQSDLK
ncbi:TPA: cell division protein DamX [Kluyvera ascorbata]|uniref:Cell division protein DamX n=1 Tax=Kluyvera genomosp. 2 TaxID=2774054 RepID=A0A2T2Y672_9ENTR|nr:MULTISPECIES: cell division protein DamX [Enterobacteriaceae]HAT3917224.1 cell division protein DamX [Kluyvera ascorbata]PSR47938.1 cell division protein DamX [Kluyvera genomosp. 2]BBQ81901.1 cell division protein DamX [Klebsiella sp. WP3-W18-ESBL-02]BBR18904.1 cell division protein DamX [Klebsiella sp. WP3-S18-ESBL-05]HAT3942137.1 cell division protein DamX [Kluyvera ascorbata]